MFSNTVETNIICAHCGDPCPTARIRIEASHFCCEGCKHVFQLLNSADLCDYYRLNEHPGITQPAIAHPNKFAFLDLPEVKAKLIRFTDDKRTHVAFYMPQMHCSSCLWLLENLHKLNSGIVSSRVDFIRKEVFIVFQTAELSVRQVVELLARIGYEPHLSLQEIAESAALAPDRTRWYKIGIAGFCFGNIMMLSLPEYFAAEGSIEPALTSLFTALIVVLSLPVIFYAASEFFISAWKGLQERYLNIDAPIALALVITFGRSMYEIISGTGPGYLDSMSGIVFFMLAGRWLQDKTYRTISFDRDYRSFFPIAVTVKRNDETVAVPVEELAIKDQVLIHHGELLPVDGMLIKGSAAVDYSFVTGESVPVHVEPGELIYAGGKQTGGLIEVMVVKEASQSYLTNLWNQQNHKPTGKNYHSFIDGLSRYFTYIVLLIGGIAATYWFVAGQPTLMWNALTTILIVACPCALLLSANFTRGNMLRILSREKFYLKHADVLEQLANVDTIVFDKTGTLTRKDGMHIRYEGKVLDAITRQQVAAVLANSTHPLSKAVYDMLGIAVAQPAADVKVTANKGIEGWIDNRHIKIGSPAFTGMPAGLQGGSAVCIMIDQQPIGTYYIQNEYRAGVFNSLRALLSQYRLAIASGDNNAEASTLQRQLGDRCDILFYQKPEDKLAYIRSLQQQQQVVLMVGDGLNDAAALQQSNVGIAITENDNNFTPAADAILHASGISKLYAIMRYAKAGRRIILITFAISILYNIIGLFYAVQGILSPVIAAILMPISSVSIILLTYGLSGWIWRLQHRTAPAPLNQKFLRKEPQPIDQPRNSPVTL